MMNSPVFAWFFASVAMIFSPVLIHAEEITTSDGQVLSASSIRRAGNNVMIKVTTPGGGVVEMGTPIARITNINFAEPPELSRARAAAQKGNAAEVLSLTAEFVSKQGDFKDLPGSWWFEMARLRLLALAACGEDNDACSLAREIGVIKSPSAESLSRGGTLFAPLVSKDTEAVVVGVKGIPVVPGDQGSALAQLALGRALLLKKDFPGAIRAFLTIKVFYPSLTLLQPAALMGSAESYVGLEDKKRAIQTLAQISETYPGSVQDSQAKKLTEELTKP